MCLAQGPQRSDAGEVPTRGPSVSSQALNHCAPSNFKLKMIAYQNLWAKTPSEDLLNLFKCLFKSSVVTKYMYILVIHGLTHLHVLFMT